MTRLRAGEIVGVDDDGPIRVEYVSAYPKEMRMATKEEKSRPDKLFWSGVLEEEANVCMPDGRTIQVDAMGPCPFCGGSMAMLRDDHEMPAAIFHSLPYCETFDRLEVEEFVHECCKKLGLSAKEN